MHPMTNENAGLYLNKRDVGQTQRRNPKWRWLRVCVCMCVCVCVCGGFVLFLCVCVCVFGQGNWSTEERTVLMVTHDGPWCWPQFYFKCSSSWAFMLPLFLANRKANQSAYRSFLPG